MSVEKRRLEEEHTRHVGWYRWGPYLSERQWGTVREDYSADGDAWRYFPHLIAPTRAYRWGEDGIAGFSDDQQLLCLGIALWNGQDPILKERLFGLTNHQGNHGEDVKELYYYLDATPTHSYLRMLYKYPQREFPYARLVDENSRRSRHEPEFELLDTGLFDDDAYFDVFVEYAKADPEDILWQVTVHNRGKTTAALHLLLQVWFRNTWSWRINAPRPRLWAEEEADRLHLEHPRLGRRVLHLDGQPQLLFTDNETNAPRLYDTPAQPGHYYKDGFHDRIIYGHEDAVNPDWQGTKAAGWHTWQVPAGGQVVVADGCAWTKSPRPSSISTPSWPAATPKPTSSIPNSKRKFLMPMPDWCSGRHWLG